MAVADIPDDERGGTMRVETGTGHITKFEHKAGARNAYIEIRATHADLRHPVKGWVDSIDDALMGVLRPGTPGHHASREIEYRIHRRRASGVDGAIAFDDLDGEQKIREVALLTIVGDASAAGNPETSTGAHAGDAAAPVEAPRRPTLAEVFDLTGACTLLAYELAAAHYPDLVSAELVPHIRRLATLFVDVVGATPQPDRASVVLRTVVGAHPVPFTASAADKAVWRTRVADDVALVLEVAGSLLHEAAA